jgi:hypothetical protein
MTASLKHKSSNESLPGGTIEVVADQTPAKPEGSVPGTQGSTPQDSTEGVLQTEYETQTEELSTWKKHTLLALYAMVSPPPQNTQHKI